LLQEANRLFLGEFGALPNASDFAILGQIAQAVLGQTQTASGTGTAGGGNMVANLGNGQPIQVQNLTIQANSVQVVSPNVQQTPGPGGTNTGGASATTGSPGPGTVPTPPNPPDSNPTGVSTPPNS
jgi:hypothetical protein